MLVSGAATAGVGAELRGRRRARNLAWDYWAHSGYRSGENHPRDRHYAQGPPAALRCPRNALSRTEIAAKSGVPGVWRPSYGDEVNRLPGILWSSTDEYATGRERCDRRDGSEAEVGPRRRFPVDRRARAARISDRAHPGGPADSARRIAEA